MHMLALAVVLSLSAEPVRCVPANDATCIRTTHEGCSPELDATCSESIPDQADRERAQADRERARERQDRRDRQRDDEEDD